MAYVILADDQAHIRRVAELALKAIGCEVSGACDGDDAWSAIHERRPDLLVTDIEMPNMDGIQLLRMLRESEEFRDLPVILLTAKAFELHNEAPELIQSCTVISKPFSPAELARQAYALLSCSP